MKTLWFEQDVASRSLIAARFEHIPIRRWKLSERSLNALSRRNPAMTVADVIRADSRIAAVSGIGAKCLAELDEKVAESMRGTSPDQMFAPEPVATESPVATLPPADTVPNSVAEISLEQLHLRKATLRALSRAGVEDVGGLIAIANADFRDVPKPYRRAAREAEDALSALMVSLGEEADVDWVTFCELRGITLLPESETRDVTHSEIIGGQLPRVIQDVLTHALSEREWKIIERRFGLNGSDELTLEALGAAFNLTRERVRQLEAKSLQVLRETFITAEYGGRHFRVRPVIAHAVLSVYAFIVRGAARPVLETELLTRLHMTFEIDAEKVKPTLALIGALAGVERVNLRGARLTTVWGNLTAAERARLEKIIKTLDDLLARETVLPLPVFDVLVRANQRLKRQDRLTLEELQHFIELCSSVERTEEGLVRGRFEFLEGRGNQVERLLSEEGQAMSLSELTRKINVRLVPLGMREVQVANLSNQLSADTSGRFAPIGKSGQWGLREWPHIETGSILRLMEQFLVSRNQPATPEEIYAYIKERRPVSENSINMYLAANRNLFVKVDRTRYGLATWAETRDAQIWNPRQVAEFVAGVFRECKAKRLEYHVVRDALMGAASVTARQAQGLLMHNPVIKTQAGEKWNERFAVFQPDYEVRLNSDERIPARKQPTLREKMSERARGMLAAAPGRKLPLTELVAKLSREFDSHKHTVYQYISNFDFVETSGLSGERYKVCRLKDSSETIFPRVRGIATIELRQKVERTLPFLTDDHVDIGLFLLSKEFEAALKNYLKTAQAKGALRIAPSKAVDELRLNDMVILAKDNGIITDLSVLNYLRQERNNRAHGTMPTLVERQLLMRNVENLAGLYIDYINVLDDAYNDLAATGK